MKVLVTGATGTVGRQVVAQLLDAGAEVRAVTRDPASAGLPEAAEVVAGDLTVPTSLTGAFEGVDRVYLFPVEETAEEIVTLAVSSGVRRIVDLSAASVTVGLHHSGVEAVVEKSGADWTHVRPGAFMANMLPVWGPMVRADRAVRYPFADEASVPVHEADIAAVAVAALLDEGHAGKAYTLTGPAPISTRDQVAAIGAALGEEVAYVEVSREEARQILKAQGGFAAGAADLLLGFVDYDGGEPSGSDGYSEQDWSALLRPWPGVTEATGRPARDFATWARDHAADFA
ncbi:NAD(P)H-binding protein [Phytomonospora sp. NPDC050363]|uniref:NmrA family NAD(P)-binding protein n=1 Tax=Phytomonospora sp. NPDC050363 TaxID=3155642 RepID=UPI00340D2E5B